MGKIQNRNYFVVHGWMVNELSLKGNELMIYSIIYGFTQNDDSGKVLSLGYLAEFAGCTSRTAWNVVESLARKNIIRKETLTKADSQRETKYYNLYSPPPNEANSTMENSSIPYRKNFNTPYEKASIPYRKNFNTPYENSSINNTNNNTSNNSKDNAAAADSNLASIYQYWNVNIRPVSPAEAEKLKALYEEVGYGNLSRAMEKAVDANARSINYVRSVARGLADGVDYDGKSKTKYQSSDEWLEEYLAEKEAEKNEASN